MGKGFDISKYAATLATSRPEEERDIETITGEIIQMKQDAGNAILGIGQRLIEAKAMLPHGEWLPWLTERVEFSVSAANRFMKLAREWTNSSALTNLGATKALTLLALPPEEREAFMAENNVVDMTSRELEKAIRERDEARQAAESAGVEAQAAEAAREKMEADMAVLKKLQASAQEAEEQARKDLEQVQAELRELRAKPVEVAVETVVDQEAVAKAREDAVAEMQGRVDRAAAARDEAEKKRKAAEAALEKARKDAADAAQVQARAERAEAELAEVRKQLAEVSKNVSASAIDSDADLAAFNVLFGQVQEQANKMRGLLIKVRSRDRESAGKLETALAALADAVRRCAE